MGIADTSQGGGQSEIKILGRKLARWKEHLGGLKLLGGW